MDHEKKRPSCRDQFNRTPEPDEWTDRFIARLRVLLDQVTGKR
jgi:hypothetical protein